MLQHKCVQFEHCLFQFSVFTGYIFIWIHIPIFNQKIKGAHYTRVCVILNIYVILNHRTAIQKLHGFHAILHKGKTCVEIMNE